MPALVATRYSGSIVWLGSVVDRDSSLQTAPLARIQARFSGVAGDGHGGLTRSSCSRVVDQYPLGTEIRNTRQFSIVSSEELAGIAAEIGLEKLDPGWIGATMVIQGIPDLTHVPPSSRLQTERGTTLTVDMENQPCHLPARVIDEHAPGTGRKFKAAARGRRGVTGWVEREGVLQVGDKVTLHIPDQRNWASDPAGIGR